MKDIILREIEGKKIFLKRTKDSFRVIKPYKNEDGSFNWFNILTGGSYANLIIVAVTVAIILGVLYEYSTNLNFLLDCFRVPGQLPICQEQFGPNIESIYNLIP